MRRGLSRFTILALALGMAFLYLPIVVLVTYSFSASELAILWGGWSLRWYGKLMADDDLLRSAFLSLGIGVISATAATVLGTLAAIVLVRGWRFRGRVLFSGLVYAPLVMPDVIMGLSLLLLFVALDFDRGFWTITAAHTTLTMGFVGVVVRARLLTLDTSLEEAAMDLGCPPFKAFRAVTLPLIWPAVAAGWMLAFTLSLDDLVIASFTTAAGTETLPMRIYAQVPRGVKPEINAICTVWIAVVSIGVVLAALLIRRSQSRQAIAALAVAPQ